MSEEIPPSSLTVGPSNRPAAGADTANTANMFRLTTGRWLELSPPGNPPRLVKPTAIVIGTWLLLAWNRFGFQGLSSPRAITRFVLVGVYGWLGLALVVLLGGVALSRIDGRGPPGAIDRARALQMTGLAHQPLLILGFVLQVLSAIPIPGLATTIAFATFLLWLPGVFSASGRALLGAQNHGLPVPRNRGSRRARQRSSRPFSWLVGLVAYLGWLSTAGRYLQAQLGHLI